MLIVVMIQKKQKKQKQQFNDSGLTTSRHTVTFNSQQV